MGCSLGHIPVRGCDHPKGIRWGSEGQSTDLFWSAPQLLIPSLPGQPSSLGSLPGRACPWLLVFHFSLRLN